MTRPGVLFSLTVAQGLYACVSLGLFSYGLFASSMKGNMPEAFIAGLVASSLSAIALVYKATTWNNISTGVKLHLILATDAFHCLVHMATFMWLVVLVTRPKECEAAGCTVAKAGTAIKSFEYALWAATATLRGIEISKERKASRSFGGEKLGISE